MLVCVCVFVHAFICLFVYVFVLVCVRLSAGSFERLSYVSLHMCMRWYVYTRVCVCVCVRLVVCLCLCAWLWDCVIVVSFVHVFMCLLCNWLEWLFHSLNV